MEQIYIHFEKDVLGKELIRSIDDALIGITNKEPIIRVHSTQTTGFFPDPVYARPVVMEKNWEVTYSPTAVRLQGIPDESGWRLNTHVDSKTNYRRLCVDFSGDKVHWSYPLVEKLVNNIYDHLSAENV